MSTSVWPRFFHSFMSLKLFSCRRLDTCMKQIFLVVYDHLIMINDQIAFFSIRPCRHVMNLFHHIVRKRKLKFHDLKRQLFQSHQEHPFILEALQHCLLKVQHCSGKKNLFACNFQISFYKFSIIFN